MPYIPQRRRNQIHDDIQVQPVNSGELNYKFTNIINDFLNYQGECYENYNAILGALEGAKLELYRRKIAPYEDKKIEENGDVY